MSGAEGSLIIGLISGTIAIVDATKKVYDAAGNAAGLPQAFREVAIRLPLVLDNLKLAEQDVQASSLTAEQSDAKKGVLEACKEKALHLEDIFKKVMPAADASRLDRYYKAVRTIGKGKSVEELMEGILKDLEVLIGSQIAELSEAIKQLSIMEPSIPSSVFDHGSQYTNSGSGPQNVHEGSGNINSNSGPGRQFIANVQHFTG
jgi:N-terminal domain on NACHT_NTPase and P-loop NTPases